MDGGLSDLETKLRSLNKSRLGSFGEYVFVSTINQVMDVNVERQS